jgi:hypothetical protein
VGSGEVRRVLRAQLGPLPAGGSRQYLRDALSELATPERPPLTAITSRGRAHRLRRLGARIRPDGSLLVAAAAVAVVAILAWHLFTPGHLTTEAGSSVNHVESGSPGGAALKD